MSWQLASVLVILSAPVLIGGYDFIAYLCGGNAATISRISIQTASEYPGYRAAICFAFGVLCAHLFVQAPHSPIIPLWLALTLFVALPVLVAFVSLVAGYRMPDMPGDAIVRAYPLLGVLIFLNMGAFIGGAFLCQTRP
jgi:hypothetical protein